jgi:hypothetical protein
MWNVSAHTLGMLLALAACEKPPAAIRGAEVAVTGIERLELWQGATAPPDHEYVVVHLRVDAHAVTETITLSHFGLENADGSRGATAMGELTLNGGAEHEPELGFTVRKGARPRTLFVDGAALDLSGREP